VNLWKEWYRTELFYQFSRLEAGSSLSKEYVGIAKLLMIGQNGVGKSCFLLRFAEDSFTDSYISTIGVDFKIITVKCGSRIWKLQIWDTAGPERFRTITSAYYRGAHGIFIMFDLGDRESFDQVRHWYEQVERYAQESCTMLLLGTQADRDRRVTFAEGLAVAQEMHIPYAECSAKTGEGVEKAVYSLLRRTLPHVARVGRNPTPAPVPPVKTTSSKCSLQ